MFGFGPGIEQNTHKIGECVDLRELEHAVALLARFPSAFVAGVPASQETTRVAARVSRSMTSRPIPRRGLRAPAAPFPAGACAARRKARARSLWVKNREREFFASERGEKGAWAKDERVWVCFRE